MQPAGLPLLVFCTNINLPQKLDKGGGSDQSVRREDGETMLPDGRANRGGVERSIVVVHDDGGRSDLDTPARRTN